ncbi:MAG: molybdopterin-dependent oxidoreductase, partial [Acidobacteria bacterium]|nr:molybdopterin-dependent oxidoreductase [Acidobacteriota bacterium]
MNAASEVSRRDFLKITSVAGSGLVLAIYFSTERDTIAAEAGESFAPNAFLRIDKTGVVTIQVAKSEMGQGVRTALPMLVAEELDADWASVRIEAALYDAKYGDQGTGGSTSVRGGWEPLRKAGAAARAMLVAAAAKTWKVDKLSCRTEKGAVIHSPTQRKLSYGELVEVAATLPVPDPKNVVLKNPKSFRLLGTRIPRLDVPEKVDATAQFGLDVKVPGMLYAFVARSPVFGGKLIGYGDSKAKAIPGVRHVVRISDGVAVVADSVWSAKKGCEELEMKWHEGSQASISSVTIKQAYDELIQKEGVIAKTTGNSKRALETAAKKIEAYYELPYQAHAPMEPMNCTADVRADRCEIWAPTQFPQFVNEHAVRITGLPSHAITVHITLLGGGFGRRIQGDYALEAVEISKAVSAPVKVIWTREDELQHDYYRPNSYHRLSGALNEQGMPIVWNHRMVAPSIMAHLFPGNFDVNEATEESASLPYTIPNFQVEWTPSNHVAPNIPLGWWRSVYPSQTAFADESFVDELAAAAGKDPYEFRLPLLAKAPRHKGVLQLAATKAGWETPLPQGHGRGIAVYFSFRSYVAQVAEVSVDKDGNVRVHRVVCAIDCGMTVNPDIIEAQMEGSI